MYTRIVTFHLAGVSADEYLAVAQGAAGSFAEWPGLISKLWLADEVSNTYGGIYVFESSAAATASRDTELFRTMVANPAFVDVTISEFDILTGPTETTGGPIANQNPWPTEGRCPERPGPAPLDVGVRSGR
jgi:hypothetical protein